MPPGIDQRVRQIYVSLASDPANRGKSPAWIHREALSRIPKMRNPPKSPGKSWAYDYLAKTLAKLKGQDWLEQPWSLTSLADLLFTDGLVNAGELVILARHAKVTDLRFTNRQARWAVRLTDVVGSRLAPRGGEDADTYRVVSNEIAHTQGLLLASQLLADEEIWAEVEGTDVATSAWIDDEAFFAWPVYGGYLGGSELGSSAELVTGHGRWSPFDARDVGELSSTSASESRRSPLESDRSADIRGGRLYSPEVQRLINAIYSVRLPDRRYWASKVTIDQFEMALVILRSAYEEISKEDQLSKAQMNQLATSVTEILGQHFDEGMRSLRTVVDESITQWRIGNA